MGKLKLTLLVNSFPKRNLEADFIKKSHVSKYLDKLGKKKNPKYPEVLKLLLKCATFLYMYTQKT